MIPAQIKTLIRKGESDCVEFIAKSQQLDRIGKAVCAFLNGKGGTVFVGVDDDGQIIGVPDPDMLTQRLQKFLNEHIRPNALWSVSIDTDDGKSLISVEVPAAKDRPYIFEGAIFIRRGSRTQVVDKLTLQRIVQSQSVSAERWERRPSVNLEENDLDHEEIAQTVREVQEARRF